VRRDSHRRLEVVALRGCFGIGKDRIVGQDAADPEDARVDQDAGGREQDVAARSDQARLDGPSQGRELSRWNSGRARSGSGVTSRTLTMGGGSLTTCLASSLARSARRPRTRPDSPAHPKWTTLRTSNGPRRATSRWCRAPRTKAPRSGAALRSTPQRLSQPPEPSVRRNFASEICELRNPLTAIRTVQKVQHQ
jgi:hypothetical protein